MARPYKFLPGAYHMDSSQILRELSVLFCDIFDDPNITIDRDTTAEDIEDWDSARMVELIMAVEAHFGVKFTTRETDALAKVGDFVDLVGRKLMLKTA